MKRINVCRKVNLWKLDKAVTQKITWSDVFKSAVFYFNECSLMLKQLPTSLSFYKEIRQHGRYNSNIVRWLGYQTPQILTTTESDIRQKGCVIFHRSFRCPEDLKLLFIISNWSFWGLKCTVCSMSTRDYHQRPKKISHCKVKCKENIIIMYQSLLIYLGKFFGKKSLDRKICFYLKS